MMVVGSSDGDGGSKPIDIIKKQLNFVKMDFDLKLIVIDFQTC